jgi:serine/threonine protein kinase
MKRILALFKKTHEKKEESPPYPPELENTYKITRKTLGVGSFAVVKECIHRSTHQPFALKIILKKAIAGKFDCFVCEFGYSINNERIGKEHMLSSELGKGESDGCG